MKIAFCDCFSGISGDMFVSALIDAGLPLSKLEEQIHLLPLDEEYELSSEIVIKNGLRARSFKVNEIHDHDHPHHEDGDHLHDGHHHHHHHRHYDDIVRLIETSNLKPSVKQTSHKIFHTLALAEAQVHGTTIDQVHFHEVGALDSIIDIVGTAIGLDVLGIQRLYASTLPWSGGDVHTDHGKMPLPAPATLELMRMAKAPLTPVNTSLELVTPTGAAILTALATFQRPDITIESLGVGSGERDLPWANIFRLIIGEVVETSQFGMIQIETNIDDMNPQVYGYVMEKLFAAGALDVYLTPIYMKKNRPGTLLGVVAKSEHEVNLAKIILEETTTLGLRVHPIYRYEAIRQFKEVETELGNVTVKCKIVDGKIVQASPEYEVCLKIAKEKNISLTSVLNASVEAAQKLIDG